MLFDTNTGLYGPITDYRSNDKIEVWENSDVIRDGKYIGGDIAPTPGSSE
jgi:hypothetical protein